MLLPDTITTDCAVLQSAEGPYLAGWTTVSRLKSTDVARMELSMLAANRTEPAVVSLVAWGMSALSPTRWRVREVLPCGRRGLSVMVQREELSGRAPENGVIMCLRKK